MKTHVLAVLAATLVAGAASGQATLYSQDRFHGRSFVVNQTVHNLDGAGFNDRASSIIVERGSWEVCDDSEFRGRCIVLRPGQYPSLAAMGLDNRVSSVRRVGGGGHYTFAPPPQAPAPYPYYQRNGERLFQANVVAVRAVTGPPEQRCWMEPQQVTAPSQPNIPGAILGGVLGGVLGHQVGSGRGRDVATGVGALAGGAVGANVGSQYGGGGTQDVQRCAYTQGSSRPDYYDVTYNFRGHEHRIQVTTPPGPTILVNDNGEPRV